MFLDAHGAALAGRGGMPLYCVARTQSFPHLLVWYVGDGDCVGYFRVEPARNHHRKTSSVAELHHGGYVVLFTGSDAGVVGRGCESQHAAWMDASGYAGEQCYRVDPDDGVGSVELPTVEIHEHSIVRAGYRMLPDVAAQSPPVGMPLRRSRADSR